MINGAHCWLASQINV